MAEEETFVLDDSELKYSYFSKVCSFCKHLIRPRTCQAFEEIPLEIWLGENKHQSSYPGDHGFQFERVTAEELK